MLISENREIENPNKIKEITKIRYISIERKGLRLSSKITHNFCKSGQETSPVGAFQRGLSCICGYQFITSGRGRGRAVLEAAGSGTKACGEDEEEH